MTNDDKKIPDNDKLLTNLDKIRYILDKEHLHNLKKDFVVLDFNAYNRNIGQNAPDKICYGHNIRAIKINRWVYDKEETIADRFKNILSTFSEAKTTVGLLIVRNISGTQVYFVVKDDTTPEGDAVDDNTNNVRLLDEAIKGNFNGTKTDLLLPEKASKLFSDDIKSIAVLANITSEKSEKFISQGLDKLLDGISPQCDDAAYSILIMAEPIKHEQVQSIKEGYTDIATALSPFISHQYSLGENSTEINTDFTSLSHSESVNRSISKTNGLNIGLSTTISKSETPISVTPSVGYSHSRTKMEGESKADTDTSGSSYGLSVGKTENTTYNYKSYAINELAEKLQEHIKRLNNGQAVGMWKCASYVLAKNSQITINVANFIRGLTQGDSSYIEPAIINEWSFIQKQEDNRPDDFDNIKKFVQHFTHPIYLNKYDYQNRYQDADTTNVLTVTPTSNVTTNELANALAFPRNSLLGLPVIQCARFGRDVISFDGQKGSVVLGNIYHMHDEEKKEALLNKDSLASHAFITGSTGAGKSNTVFCMLKEISNADETLKFLVIEPAKGEYKDVFGKSAKIYGTNPKIIDLLRINPFSFPENITVYEHIDRLVEIFNVCWPMYAAMPAILKDAVIRAYEVAGWNIEASENVYSDELYPAFQDVLEQIRLVLRESEYSADNKGDYTGALVTRIKSLTNGIYGQIFSCNSLSDSDLFDQNVIVDLSRIGSVETKALVMGLLVMKLQEYRISKGKPDSEGLRHITVLEEAHNLLKRTSTEQQNESSNLLGKSVEMLANSIAELRAFGEGFIIADQSPGLLDMAVIRNTNTKIIHRLPDYTDRVLVGRAAGLNDDQINELAKLQRGVAAIYQNDWIAPVLCKVPLYKQKESYLYKGHGLKDYKHTTEIKKVIADILLKPNEYIKFDEQHILNSSLSATAKGAVLEYLFSNIKRDTLKKAEVAFKVFGNTETFGQLENCSDIDKCSTMLIADLNNILIYYSEFERQNLIALILRGQAEQNNKFEVLYNNYVAEISHLGGLI